LEYLEDGRFKIIQKVEYDEPLNTNHHLTDSPESKKYGDDLEENPYRSIGNEKTIQSPNEIKSPEKNSHFTDLIEKEDDDDDEEEDDEDAMDVLNQYGSLEKGDIPLKIIGIRPVLQEDDLEAMVSWYPRPNGFTPENSRVMRFDMMKRGFIMPLIEYYESKMKLGNGSSLDFSQIPK